MLDIVPIISRPILIPAWNISFADMSGLFSLISCNDDETDIATSITAPNDAISIPENSIPPMSSLEFWPTYIRFSISSTLYPVTCPKCPKTSAIRPDTTTPAIVPSIAPIDFF